jgi:glutamine synthetase
MSNPAAILPLRTVLVPRALYEAIEAFDESAVAREAFGEVVVEHYLNAARVEQEAYDNVVTDWERERYLERG